MIDIDLNEYTNSELEEMGIPAPCECLITYREYTDDGDVLDVCEDCGVATFAGRRAGAW